MKIEPINKLVAELRNSNASKKTGLQKTANDSFEFSDTSKVLNKVDSFFNLGKKDRLNLSDMNSEEKEEFCKIVAALIQKGIIGYEEFEINGQIEKHDLVNQIGDKRLYGAKPKTVRRT